MKRIAPLSTVLLSILAGCSSTGSHSSTSSADTTGNGTCIANGNPSRECDCEQYDTNSCCSGAVDANGICAPPTPCTAAPQPSVNGDGSDCCSSAVDSNGNCVATDGGGGGGGAGAVVTLAPIDSIFDAYQPPRGVATDGKNVYFTTGPAWQVPVGGGSTTRLGGSDHGSGIASDGVNVYWGDNGGSTLEQVPVGGATLTNLVPHLSLGDVFGVATDGANIYFARTGSIDAVPVGGGTLTTLATGQLTPMNIVTDGTNVYWTTQSGTVMQASVSGGAPTVLASGQNSPWGVATDGTNVYFTNSGASSQLNNDGSLILAGPKGTGSVGTGSVMEVPVGGGTVVTLASGLTEPAGIATDGTNVYWDDFADGSVNEVSIAGGSPTTLASNLGHPGAMATDGTNVYLATLTTYASPGDTANSPGSVLAISLK